MLAELSALISRDYCTGTPIGTNASRVHLLRGGSRIDGRGVLIKLRATLSYGVIYALIIMRTRISCARTAHE